MKVASTGSMPTRRQHFLKWKKEKTQGFSVYLKIICRAYKTMLNDLNIIYSYKYLYTFIRAKSCGDSQIQRESEINLREGQKGSMMNKTKRMINWIQTSPTICLKRNKCSKKIKYSSSYKNN